MPDAMRSQLSQKTEVFEILYNKRSYARNLGLGFAATAHPKMTTVQDGSGATFSCLPMSQHSWGMRRARGHSERSGLFAAGEDTRFEVWRPDGHQTPQDGSGLTIT